MKPESSPPSCAAQGANACFYVGTYNQPGPYFHAQGEGLTTCALDETTGEIRPLRVNPEVENAGFVVATPGGLLAATDRYFALGEVSSFTQSKGAGLTHRATQKGFEGAVCHVAHSPANHLVLLTAYMTGITVHRMGEDAVVMPSHQKIKYTGSGPNKGRQEAPHPHQCAVSPDEKFVFVPDLGSDRLWVHAVKNGQLSEAVGVEVEPGAGPRHAVCHPTLPRLYLFCELDAKVRVFGRDGGNLRLLATHATLPAGFTGTPAGAAIRLHPSNQTLFVSNRESDSLAHFRIDANGDLHSPGQIKLDGKNPRDFEFSRSGRWLVCVLMDSHLLTAYEVDAKTGLPTGKSGRPFACGSPASVTFA